MLRDNVALVEGLRSGDTAAQQVFWRTFWEKTYLICMRILGRDPDATDAAMDLMTDFLDRHVKNLSDPQAVWGYLRLMAIRQSLHIKKKQEKSEEIDFEIEDIRSRTPENAAIVATLSPRLGRCLARLTPKAQHTLRLKYSEDLTNEEIGHRLGGSKQYIGRLLRKSLTTLRTCLEKGEASTTGLREQRMTFNKRVAITPETVAQLLAARPRYRDQVEDQGHATALADMALVVSGVADERTEKEVDGHLEHCPVCREVLLNLHRIGDVSAPSGFETTASVNARSNLSRMVPMAAAALVLVGITTLFVMKSPDTPSPDGKVHVKGFEDDLFIAVKRENRRFRLRPMDNLLTDDQLGFSYAATRSGYVMVVSRDTAGRSALIHPASGSKSAPIFAGENIALPGGAVVEQGTGCEWIVALFSDEPLDARKVLDAVEKGTRSGMHCGINIPFPSARTIRIIPIVR